MAMARVLASLLVVASLVSLVAGHAVLTSPPSWNPNPSKTAPCGAGKAFTTTTTTAAAGSVLTLTWKVVAGDGTGAVSISIDQAGGTTFTLVGVATPTTITAVGVYTLSITLPTPLVCTGAGGLCTLQAKSTTNWYSCTTFKLPGTSSGSSTGSSVATSTGSAGSTCTIAPALRFCTAVTGKSIDYSANPQLDADSIADWDATVNSTYVQNINSKLVFTHQHNDACLVAYKKFICAQNMPLCGTIATGTCALSCSAVASLCGINATHAELFTCPGVNTRTTSDSWGTCQSSLTSQTSSALTTSTGADMGAASPIAAPVSFVRTLAIIAVALAVVTAATTTD